MAKKSERTALLMDTRLSDTAVRIGLYIESLGPGLHRISSDDLARVCFGTPSRETVTRSLRALRMHEYIEQLPGGRGHPDRFAFRSSPETTLNTDSTRWEDDLNADRSSPQHTLNTDRSSPGPYLSVSHAGRARGDAAFLSLTNDEVEEGEPPIIPLSTDAERALRQHSDLLTGCRGALRDYLRQCVAPEKQYAYVQTVAGWLNDLEPVFRLPDGSSLHDRGERTKALGNALNLLAASEERMMTRPIGDPDNLRTKLNVQLRKRSNGERNGSYDRAATGASSSEAAGPGRGKYAGLDDHS